MNYQKGEMAVYFSGAELEQRNPIIENLTERQLRILFPDCNDLHRLTYRQKLNRFKEANENDEICFDEYGEIQLPNYHRNRVNAMQEEADERARLRLFNKYRVLESFEGRDK